MSFQVGSRVTIINEDGTPVTSAVLRENIGGHNVPMVKVQYDNGRTENIKRSRITAYYPGETFPNTIVPRRRLYGGKSRRLRRRSNRNRRSRRRT